MYNFFSHINFFYQKFFPVWVLSPWQAEHFFHGCIIRIVEYYQRCSGGEDISVHCTDKANYGLYNFPHNLMIWMDHFGHKNLETKNI